MATNEALVITGKDNIAATRLLSMYFALKMECKGLKHSRGSVYKLVKTEFNLKGNKEKVRAQFAKILMDQDILSHE